MSIVPPRRSRGVRSRAAAASLLLLGLVVAGLGAARPVGSAAPEPSDRADAAVDWLAAQLGEHGGAMPGFTPGSTDWGLTADAVLAFAAAGRGDDHAAQTATDLLTAHLAEYTTWDPDVTGVRVAGAVGKVLLVLGTLGRDTAHVGAVGGVGGVDLEAELRSLMVHSGGATGRFTDRVPDPTWDASNGFGQALSMLALAWTDDGIPAASVDFLLDQQCPSGGFRLTYAPGATCTDDASSDTDATALALQALLAARSLDARPLASDPDLGTLVEVAAGRALGWLVGRQDSGGAIGGTGPTAAWNSNSTGVVGQALRAAGRRNEAEAAASWITSMTQLSAPEVDGTPAAVEEGAIAYDPAARAAALSAGISDGTADQWRRATSQAVLALGLAPFAPVRGGPVVVSPTTTPTTTPGAPTAPPIDAAPTTTAPDATSIMVGADGVGTVMPTPATDGATSTSGSATSAGRATSTGRATSAATPRSLAVTGQEPAPLVWMGLGLLFAGAVTVRATRRGRESFAFAVICAASAASIPLSTTEAGAQQDGSCRDPQGVTVVVDFQALGGGVHVRCAPWPVSTGFDTLTRAGIEFQTTTRSPGFLCRIAGMPASDPCLVPSPATAYWSYWLATRGGQWCYSDLGAGNRQPAPGTVEGWSFSLSADGSTSPPPRVAVPAPLAGTARTGSSGADCDTSANAPPSTPGPVRGGMPVDPMPPPATSTPGSGGLSAASPPAPDTVAGDDALSGTADHTEGGEPSTPTVGADPITTTTVDDLTNSAVGTRVPSDPADRDAGTGRDNRAESEEAGTMDLDSSGTSGDGSPLGVLVAVTMIGALGAGTVLIGRRARRD